MYRLNSFIKFILRFLLLWAVDGFSLIATAWLLPGINIVGDTAGQRLTVAFAAAFLLGVVNLLIRPLVLLLARPLGFIAVFLIGFLVNALALLLTARLLDAFQVNGLLSAIIGGIIFSAINVLLTGVLEVEDEGSFYQGLMERLARRRSFMHIEPENRGLVMMEIDGLSYHHLHKALEDGRMPTLTQMMREEGYELSKVDCGIPSQTSACQAGIMFGDNSDIPAFRWYDKGKQKLYVSGNDAAELNSRYAAGNGLMRNGSSINNMLNGDAEKSLLTLADLLTGSDDEKKARAQDIYLLLLNPYFLTRTIALMFTDAVREIWQGWQQKRNNVVPRLDRLHHAYPIVRAITTVFMRDVAANLTILDIIRGAPAIYVTWPGYDEVAHHSGPWTEDAFKVLATYDKVIARVRDTIRHKAPRPYDLVILSDHGQSFGLTFKMRYGLSLKEFIEQQLPQGTTVSASMGGDTGAISVAAVSGELENIQEVGMGGRAGKAAAKQSQKLVESGSKRMQKADAVAEAEMGAQVTAYGSGNLAQVYLDLYPRKITISELNEAYPGMVDALVQHEGIGLVCGYDDEGVPVALSKNGRRNLHTGEIEGEDPLLPYAPAKPAYGASTIETRAWQVRRVMDFPNAGDLMVISTVFPDGTVAALEELIGNHGGLGGEQTDAFIFHPPDMAVPETRNSIDVYHILNARRGLPAPVGEAAATAQIATKREDDWAPANLWAGLKDVRTWLGLAAQVFAFNRMAFREVSNNRRMTGPAILLAIIFVAIGNAARARADFGEMAVGVSTGLLGWLLAALAIFIAGRLLTRKGYFTRTMRALGFAQVVHVFDLLVLLPPLAPLAIVLTTLLAFLATWLAAAEAHETRGWRTLLLPVLGLIVVVGLPILVAALLSGAAVGVEAVLEQLGLTQP